MKQRNRLPQLSLLVLAAFLLGCGGGDGPVRFHLRGKVTYNGQPVPKGRIVFEPDATQGLKGPQGFALIENGEYSTKATGKGAIGGRHQIIISGFDGNPRNDNSLLGSPLFPPHRETRDLPREAAVIDFNLPAS